MTFTATVSAVSPGVGTPSTTVTFYNGAAIPANQIGTGTLAGGVASFSTNSLAVGNYTITAVYGGDSNLTAQLRHRRRIGHHLRHRDDACRDAEQRRHLRAIGDVDRDGDGSSGKLAGPVNSGTVSFYYDVAVPVNLLGTSGTVTNGVASISSSALPVSAAHAQIGRLLRARARRASTPATGCFRRIFAVARAPWRARRR